MHKYIIFILVYNVYIYINIYIYNVYINIYIYIIINIFIYIYKYICIINGKQHETTRFVPSPAKIDPGDRFAHHGAVL